MSTTARLDYLQRVGLELSGLKLGGGSTTCPPELRRVLHITGIGRSRKQPTLSGTDDPGSSMDDAITGLYGYRLPLVFSMWSAGQGVTVEIGTWSPLERERAPTAVLDTRSRIVQSVLRTLYPTIELTPATPCPLTDDLIGGFVLGVPTNKTPDADDGSIGVDRLIRALAGGTWAVTVLAEPVEEAANEYLRNQILNEIRSVETEAQAEGAPSALAQHYRHRLTDTLASYSYGLTAGAWRTGVYLVGDRDTYYGLASAWRAIFSGQRSVPEPIRVFDDELAVNLSRDFVLPDARGPESPGSYRHPFAVQTLLNSAQLAAYVQLPNVETPGFRIDLVPRFDAVATSPATDGVTVGSIEHQRRDTQAEYRIPIKSLTRHVFVAGATGSGKTNTIQHLLMQLAAHSIPFLVIEPAKTEYRSLLRRPEVGCRVFTAGKEHVSPLRFNPFEVPPGGNVAEHVDLLRAVFRSSFAMWGPLPQVLERSLLEVYTDRGWDLRSNRNHRLGDENPTWSAFPTFADLTAKVRQIVPALGYEQRTSDDIRAALLTRLNSLRSGGKGAMLDVARSIPMGELLDAPTVIELEGMGDDDDKAFLIGLLLIRLVEHRRAAGRSDELEHLLVVEEAHRLLTNVSRDIGGYVGNPRGQAVETFTNLLSEIRAYGQGVLIADQVPVRLAPDVLKNTNLKIAHRIVAVDDRAILGGTMSMNDPQSVYLSTLRTGRAAVFSEGDDSPMLINVPRAELGPSIDDSDVRAASAAWLAERQLESLYHPKGFCAQTCTDATWACELARRMVEDPVVTRTVARVALAAAEHPEALDRLWADIVAVLRARRPTPIDEQVLLSAFAGHAADWYAYRRGTQAGWSYEATEALAATLREMLAEKAAGETGPTPIRAAFQEQMRDLHQRSYPPLPACDRICNHAPICLYRPAVVELIETRRYQNAWQDAEAADSGAEDRQRRTNSWRAAWSSTYELVEIPLNGMDPAVHQHVTASARRAALCFAQHMTMGDDRKVPSTARWVIQQILTAAGDGES